MGAGYGEKDLSELMQFRIDFSSMRNQDAKTSSHEERSLSQTMARLPTSKYIDHDSGMIASF